MVIKLILLIIIINKHVPYYQKLRSYVENSSLELAVVLADNHSSSYLQMIRPIFIKVALGITFIIIIIVSKILNTLVYEFLKTLTIFIKLVGNLVNSK